MVSIDESKLNPLERRVLETLSEFSESHSEPRIVEAAKVCGCSVSMVSETVKKAGFPGYRHYLRYLYFGDQPRNDALGELQRLKAFIDDFDLPLMHDFVDLITDRKKIILFGYGPSQICAQYVEYKLRFCVDASVVTPPDEPTVRRMADDESLLVILTTTGQYRSFEDLIHDAESRGADVVVVSEEFNSVLMESCDRYICLSDHKQAENLEPHEKTRTVFFIFFEQVVQELLRRKASSVG